MALDKNQTTTVSGILIAAVIVLVVFVSCSSALKPAATTPDVSGAPTVTVPDDAMIKARAEGALLTQPVSSVDVQNGNVVVTLNVTKEMLAPGGGDVGAEDAGRSIAGLIFTDAPTGIGWVRIVDGNRKRVGMYQPDQ